VRGEIHDDDLMGQTLKRFTPAIAVSVVLQALLAGATLAGQVDGKAPANRHAGR
jgi:hypothetical protein